jgi:hypothetical protein
MLSLQLFQELIPPFIPHCNSYNPCYYTVSPILFFFLLVFPGLLSRYIPYLNQDFHTQLILVAACLAYSSALKMVAVHVGELSADYTVSHPRR